MKARPTSRSTRSRLVVREEPVREDRIVSDIVVDAYDEHERAMSWYYYLQDAMQVPFDAICTERDATSPLKVGQVVQVLSMADEDDCASEMRVSIAYDDDELSVPLAQLQLSPADDKPTDGETENAWEQTRQAVDDWRYWIARGYQF